MSRLNFSKATVGYMYTVIASVTVYTVQNVRKSALVLRLRVRLFYCDSSLSRREDRLILLLKIIVTYYLEMQYASLDRL